MPSAWPAPSSDRLERLRKYIFPDRSKPGEIAVAKEWHTTDDSSVLIEAVLWEDIAAALAALPEVAGNGPPSEPKDRLVCLKDVSTPRTTAQAAAPVRLASAEYRPTGVALDYTTVNQSQGGYTFTNGNYCKIVWAYFDGPVVFQQGCVLKFAGELLMWGTVTCGGSCSTPSVLTSVYDSLYGGVVSNGCPTSLTGTPFWIYYADHDVSLGGFLVRYVPMKFDGPGCNPPYPDGDGAPTRTYTVQDSVFESCGTAISAHDVIVAIQNCSESNVDTPISTSGCAYSTGSFSSGCGGASLLDHVVDATKARATGHSPSTDEFLFTNNTFTNYNTNCWIYGIHGFTSLSPSNYIANCSECVWYQGAGTLITNHYAIAASHTSYGPPGLVGAPCLFVGANNDQNVVVCAGVEKVTVPGY